VNVPLRFLLDENLRGPLWNAILRHNLRGVEVLDVVRVGDASAPSLHSPDADILSWAETHDRILVTLDRSTMPDHLNAHLAAGRHSPGIYLVRREASIADVMEYLLLAAYVSVPEEWLDRIVYIP
jgi:hypothetical protein